MATQLADSVHDESWLECRHIWEGTFDVDQNDPFFFDHPLDHVPAMLLLEAVLHTAERAAAETPAESPAVSPEGGTDRHLARLRLTFTRFCELNSAPLVRVWAEPGRGRWAVEFCQDGATIGSGEIEWRPVTAVPAARNGHDGQNGQDGQNTAEPEPVPGHLVHRSRPENVLVGNLEQTADDVYQVGVLAPPPGHYLRRRDERFRPVSELLEGARQFGTLLGHTAREVNLDTQFVVKSLEVELTRPVSRDEPLSIVTRSLPEQRRRGKGSMTFAIKAGDEIVGTAAVHGSAFSAQAYERIRALKGN